MAKANLILSTLVVLLTSGAISAQTHDYRSIGYHGSVSVTDHLGVFVGAETSHGVMLTKRNYLGAGIGGFILPNGTINPLFGNAFIEWRHFHKEEPNTTVLMFKGGYSYAFNYNSNSGVSYKNGILLEPDFGWDWKLRNGCGLNFSIGAAFIVPFGDYRTDKYFLPLPKISLGFEF